MYILYYICVQIAFVDFTSDKGLHMKTVLKCALSYESLIILRWPGQGGWQDIKIQLLIYASSMEGIVLQTQ